MLDLQGTLRRGGLARLEAALDRGAIRFRTGSTRGVLPTIQDACVAYAGVVNQIVGSPVTAAAPMTSRRRAEVEKARAEASDSKS